MRRAPVAVERASSSDAFGLLGLPAQFDLDPQVIERAFYDRSKDLHPDRFANAPAAERVVALSQSRALNDAYKTLKNPVKRAEYLLAQAGVTIGPNEKLDPAFLMEILELREELADAQRSGNAAKVAAMAQAMRARHADALASLAAALDDESGAKLEEAARLMVGLRYYQRFLDEVPSEGEAAHG